MKLLLLETRTYDPEKRGEALSKERTRAQQTAHDIQEMLRFIHREESIEFVTYWAVGTEDLMYILDKEEPDLIHMNGTCCGNSIELRDKKGCPHFVGADILSDILDTLNKKVQMLFLDMEESDRLAQILKENVEELDTVIGFGGSLDNQTARVFSAQFYYSLFKGSTVKRAVKWAGTQVRMNSMEFPEVCMLSGENAGIVEKEMGAEKECRILMVASLPENQNPLNLDEEAAVIQKRIDASSMGHKINFTTRWCVKADELLDTFNQVQPQVLHFSGHGNTGFLVFDEDGDSEHGFTPVFDEYMAEVLRTAGPEVRIAMFSACHSIGAANAATQYVDAAIGNVWSIGDDAATAFAAQFYSSLGYGCDVVMAFEQAKVAMMLTGNDYYVPMLTPEQMEFFQKLAEEEGRIFDADFCEEKGIKLISEVDIPQLIIREGVDPYDIYLIS